MITFKALKQVEVFASRVNIGIQLKTLSFVVTESSPAWCIIHMFMKIFWLMIYGAGSESR